MAGGKGLHLKVVDRSKFVEDGLAAIFVMHGCSVPLAYATAKTVATVGERKTTVKPSLNLAHLRNDCSVYGVIVIEIPPRRA